MAARRARSFVRGSSFLSMLMIGWALIPPVTLAQMPEPYLSVGVRGWTGSGTCADAPGACGGPTYHPLLGPHEFVVHRVPHWSPLEVVQIRLQWPESWSFLDWDLCYGKLVSGDPSIRGSRLAFRFPDCEAEDQPFLRVRLDCPTSGTFNVIPSRLVNCWGEDVDECLGLYADVGDICLAQPYGPCDLCYAYLGSAGFNPRHIDVMLPPDAVQTDTLGFWASPPPPCARPPVCGHEMVPCFTGIEAEETWLNAVIFEYPPEEWGGYFRYSLTIDTAGMGPGHYQTRVVAPGTGCCDTSCMSVDLIVLEPGDVPPRTETTAGDLLGVLYPNPMDRILHYTVRLTEPSRVRTMLLDASGRHIATVLDDDLPAGESLRTWIASEALRGTLTSGVYFLRLEAGGSVSSRMVVVRR